ncbi:hypothetical protein P691DRAFT_805234 [Macrolepiota fuliginosa MF-IS2]|uniref:Uncharacterized protein n=1 Tax=Macrolepiota fuliginosa MF-IS2 TaxID=1400762 RepID=A0A9P5XAH4_9AGAR|nr:hypothetical protein P691DRAFT_805234 [Macrolepiota fuliginosa MF-IS2]
MSIPEEAFRAHVSKEMRVEYRTRYPCEYTASFGPGVDTPTELPIKRRLQVGKATYAYTTPKVRGPSPHVLVHPVQKASSSFFCIVYRPGKSDLRPTLTRDGLLGNRNHLWIAVINQGSLVRWRTGSWDFISLSDINDRFLPALVHLGIGFPGDKSRLATYDNGVYGK